MEAPGSGDEARFWSTNAVSWQAISGSEDRKSDYIAWKLTKARAIKRFPAGFRKPSGRASPWRTHFDWSPKSATSPDPLRARIVVAAAFAKASAMIVAEA